jgi:hypothetical protein
MKRGGISKILFSACCFTILASQSAIATPIGTAFTYQGRLMDNNQPADGLYDFQFKLFDANNAGNKLGADVNISEVDVIDGYFTVEIDFGSVFDGNNRWLEKGVRPGDMADPNAYTVLSPRQKLSPTPYALYAKTSGRSNALDAADGSPQNAVYVDNAGNVGMGTTSPGTNLHIRKSASGGAAPNATYDPLGIESSDSLYINLMTPASRYSGLMFSDDIRGRGIINYGHADDKMNFYTNGTLQMSIASNGYVGIGTTSPASKLDVIGDIGTDSAYMIDGNAVLSITEDKDTFIGVDAGAITTGAHNTFAGHQAGYSNTIGHHNTFVGSGAGLYSTGNSNTFLGCSAGIVSTSGSDNTFLGYSAGWSNYDGSGNVFIGYGAGYWETGSNKLIISNDSDSTAPLIYGDFSARTVGINTTTPARNLHIKDVMRLQPRATSPSSPAEGDIYMNSTTHKLMVYDGTAWQACW